MKNDFWNRLACRVMLCLLAMLLAPGFIVPSLAQFTTARLAGAVLDPSGAGLGGAKVTVKDELTSYTKTLQQTTRGDICFPASRSALTRLPSP